jgi:AraC-like DNA-binding protein
VINNHIGKNFRDWINSYRITHFLTQYPILADKITIEAIAQEAGFKNQATFYNAFKKEKGIMPRAYFSQELNTERPF